MTDAPVIHIVDDDAPFRIAISRLLKISGYEIADYASADCFLHAVDTAKPGCILLDVQMPAYGGLQLQAELARLSRHWPIIFMTGHGDLPSSVRAIKAGAEDFLPSRSPNKPCWTRSNARSPASRASNSTTVSSTYSNPLSPP